VRLISEDAFGILTVWAEARGEPYEGKRAVAEVIQRRAAQHWFSDGTVAGAVLRPSQFSCWRTADPNFVPMLRIDDANLVVQECAQAWAAAKAGDPIVPGALMYVNLEALPVVPSWVAASEVVAKIGHHTFLKPQRGA
jgi:spore germination cell wall hydrolase CwlJ-like protein